MRPVPWWAVLSASCAPVFLIGGWTLAASLQPPGYDPVVQSISALAARGASDRWVMTGALAALGACHAVSALGLRPAAPFGRLLLAGGGVAAVLVAVFPLPEGGTSARHAVAAGISFTALALWPALASRRGPGITALLRPGVAVPVTVLLVGLAGWFAVQLHSGTRVGLAERVVAAAEAMWPLLATVAAYRYRPLISSGSGRRPGRSCRSPSPPGGTGP
jgi:hypothetical membrane protein